MTDEEIFDLAGAEEDMGPELEDGGEEEGALEKVRNNLWSVMLLLQIQQVFGQ